MRNKRIDEFRIAHVFGAIAVAVALYGIWLAAAALLEQPRQASAAQPVTFWTAASTPIDPSPRRADLDTRSATSFWQPRPRATPASRLAGDFAAARGQL